MSELFLVRHGQASFDSDNYDQLSPMGHEQAHTLARYWQGLELSFDALYCGTLQRQRETAEALVPCVNKEATQIEGFNEYMSHGLFKHYLAEFAERDGFDVNGNLKDRRHFQLVLEAACARWITGELAGEGIEPFVDFKARVQESLDRVMAENASGKKVVVATSGGVIAMAVQHVLGCSDAQAVNLNWMVYNASVTRILYGRGSPSLSVFNSIPHLEQVGHQHMVTYR